jgi:hypothetical protein
LHCLRYCLLVPVHNPPWCLLLPTDSQVSGSDIPAPLRSWAELGPRWGATGGTLISSITNILAASSTATKESQAGGAKQVAGAGAAAAAATTPKGKAAHKGVAKLLEALRQENLDQPTPIQRQAVPSLLAGRELLGVAPTGRWVKSRWGVLPH